MESVIYTDKTGIKTNVIKEEMVQIPVQEYRELIVKANALDTIADDIRFNINNGATSYGIISEDLVRILTGTKAYVKPSEKTEAADE